MEQVKKRLFYVFLLVQAFLWVLISLTRQIASVDAMEAVAWGDLISLGTNKHPPLSGWLMGIFYNLFGQHDIAIYVLGEVCIVVGLIFVYKLAKYFLSEEKAMCSAMIMSICFYYTYHTYINNYNCNIISMGLWPVIAYYFYKSVKENKIKDWVIFGITAGLGVLAKYQVVLLFMAFFFYLVFFDRKQLKQKGLYIASLFGILTILPHAIWLYKTDFFSLIYIMSRTEVSSGNTPSFLLPFGRIIFPIKFYLNQIMAILPCVALYLILALKEKNISVNKSSENLPEKVFILLVGLLPIFILGATGAISNSRVIGAWGSTMLSYIGLILFYFFPIKFSEKTFDYFIKWLYVIVIMWIVGMGIFAVFQTQSDISYPKVKIMSDFDNIWAKETNNAELKYVGGNLDDTFQFRLYNSQHPTVILETFGYKNPWINHEDVLKSGAIIMFNKKQIDKNININGIITDYVTLLPKDANFELKKYTYKICNVIGKCNENILYYSIVKPAK